MQLTLCAVEPELATAWTRFCGDLSNVTVHHGSIFDIACDAYISPANSFGFMDGGIDLLYSQRLGWHLEERLQALIRTHHHGELLVGAADIVPTDHPRVPYLIAAPTMRVPMILKESVNPYLAARAVFLLIQHGVFRVGPKLGEPVRDHLQHIAMPGLGTGVGRVGVNTCAKQVRQAIDDVLEGQFVFPRAWSEIQHRHQGLYTASIRDLQRD